MKIQILSVMCSMLQIVGLVLIVLGEAEFLKNFTPVLIGIAGFATIVRYFLHDIESDSDKVFFLRPIVVVVGIGIIVFACTM